jgi:hypothetical protein
VERTKIETFENWHGLMVLDTPSSKEACFVTSSPTNEETLAISTHGVGLTDDGRWHKLDLFIEKSPNASIKIDNNKPNAASKGLVVNRKKLIQELMNGNQAVVLWLKSSKPTRSTFPLNGFAEAYKTAKGWCDSWANNATPKSSSKPKPTSKPKSTSKSYSSSRISYKELDAQVGCKSKYSDAKKEDIFNARYKNRWMTWRGEVLLADSDEASLNLDGKGIQDLEIDFADKNAGYHLTKGQFITVRFVMKTAGGCFLPFTGDDAIIVRQ